MAGIVLEGLLPVSDSPGSAQVVTGTDSAALVACHSGWCTEPGRLPVAEYFHFTVRAAGLSWRMGLLPGAATEMNAPQAIVPRHSFG